jgi:hypothetical protein
MIGNYLYYRHVKTKIIEIRSTQLPENYFPVLQEMGGVHTWVVTVSIIISILMAILFAVFFSTMIAAMGHFVGITI